MKTIGPLKFPTSPIINISKKEKTPFYIYDEQTIINKCKAFITMPNAYGLLARYAMKANSSKALLQLISSQGLGIDASSLNEAMRAVLAGINPNKIMLTSQEVPSNEDLPDLFKLIKKGMVYTICSITQLKNIAPFVTEKHNEFAIRVHPGVGTGESTTRDTGGDYASFGVHLTDIEEIVSLAKSYNIVFTKIHVHVGSGGCPKVWKNNIDRELDFIKKWFPNVTSVNFGGGFKEARMPNEDVANIVDLGEYAKKRVEEFYKETNRKLFTEVEPGTYIMANSGYLVTRVKDIKQTGKDGFTFVLLDGGMETLTRPLLYGSQHPFYIISNKTGNVIYDDFSMETQTPNCESVAKTNCEKLPAGTHTPNCEKLPEKPTPHIVVGRCCETGDSFTLDENQNIITRNFVQPSIGDLFIVGGVGAYASSMSPFNYNSHQQIAEYLYKTKGNVQCIRKRQSLKQIIQNELPL